MVIQNKDNLMGHVAEGGDDAARQGHRKYIPNGKGIRNTLRAVQAGIEAGVPVALVGNPGGGKTSTVEALADRMVPRRTLTDISMATMIAEDVSGNPKAMEEDAPDGKRRMVTRYSMPEWQADVLDDPYSIMFLDEFNTATPSTQRAFLKILQSRTFPSGFRFSDRVAIILAVNPGGQSDGNELSLALKNRIMWLEFNPRFEDLADGFRRRWIGDEQDDLVISEPDEDEILEREKKYADWVARFVEEKQAMRWFSLPSDKDNPNDYNVKKGDEAQQFIFEQTYATPRSYDNLVRVLARIDHPENNQSLLESVVYGIIGRKVGVEFTTYFMQQTHDTMNYKAAFQNPGAQDWSSVTPNQMEGMYRYLQERAEKGEVTKALDVLFTICDYESPSGKTARNLINGVRIKELYRHEYFGLIRDPKVKEQYKTKYREYFNSWLRRSNS